MSQSDRMKRARRVERWGKNEKDNTKDIFLVKRGNNLRAIDTTRYVRTQPRFTVHKQKSPNKSKVVTKLVPLRPSVSTASAPSKPQNGNTLKLPYPITGTRRALLIGINYFDDPNNRLNGCVNDVKNIREVLISFYGYKAENIVLMSDDQTGPMRPTKANILSQINKMVSLLKSGDVMFLHYSGHGTQIQSVDGDERNNLDTPNQDDCRGHVGKAADD